MSTRSLNFDEDENPKAVLPSGGRGEFQYNSLTKSDRKEDLLSTVKS